MKKKLLLMAACLGAMFAFTACGSKDDGNTLTVLNYGKYIESSVLDAFEEETGIHVNYEEYVNPEEMYTKYKSGAIDYDVICTSDYMVERLINEGEAKEINFDKIPLSKNLDDSYFEFSKAFDPENMRAARSGRRDDRCRDAPPAGAGADGAEPDRGAHGLLSAGALRGGNLRLPENFIHGGRRISRTGTNRRSGRRN